MKIEHIGVWTQNLEAMKTFYMKYFSAAPGERYTNAKKQFSSYFLTFPDGGTRLELMQMPGIEEQGTPRGSVYGWAHLAMQVNDRQAVNRLTESLRGDGYTVTSEPRQTGDGYYESVVLDPEGNQLEICSA